MNWTGLEIKPTAQYIPPEPCINWCIEQKVVGYHNIELQVVMIAATSLLFIVIGEWLREFPKTAPYAHYLFYFAKLSLYFFFYVYFFHVKGGV